MSLRSSFGFFHQGGEVRLRFNLHNFPDTSELHFVDAYNRIITMIWSLRLK
jgi:hypothetical protein